MASVRTGKEGDAAWRTQARDVVRDTTHVHCMLIPTADATTLGACELCLDIEECQP
jgi:hypothetical protein